LSCKTYSATPTVRISSQRGRKSAGIPNHFSLKLRERFRSLALRTSRVTGEDFLNSLSSHRFLEQAVQEAGRQREFCNRLLQKVHRTSLQDRFDIPASRRIFKPHVYSSDGARPKDTAALCNRYEEVLMVRTRHRETS
jgi:hypothetical protein